MKTRHHGDLHLGQVVVVRDDFYILDFEGEPLRTMEQRRAKHSPLRDVAGMLRSFNYAASAALSAQKDLRPGAGEQNAKAVHEWEVLTLNEFLQSYQEAIAGCPSVPAHTTDYNRLLNFFVLEKALYEICYETANRPDWLLVPAEGVQRLISANE